MRGAAIVLNLSLVTLSANAAQTVLVLRSAEVRVDQLHSDPPRPPANDLVPALHVALPDDLGRRIPAVEGVVWYQLDFQVDTTRELFALYIPHAHANVVAYLNGEWIGQGGRFAQPAAHVWNRPLFFEFDGKNLLPGPNVLDVGVQADGAIFNRLDPVMVAPARALRATYERDFALRIPPAQLSTVLAVLISLLFGYLGIALREASYGALASAAGCYAIASLNCHMLEPPVSTWTFNTLTNLCLQWYGFTLARLGFIWARVAPRGIDRITLALVGITGAMALALPGRAFERAMMWGFAAVALYALAALVAIWRARGALGRPEWITYCLLSSILLGTGLRDILLLQTRVDGSGSPRSVFFVPYFGTFILAAAAASLFVRFLGVYARAQRTNQQIEAELGQKTQELRLQHERVRDAEQLRIVLEERERLVREIHDGVGGHLVAAAALLELGGERAAEARRAVRDALDDLRIVIYALDPQLGDVSLLLAEFRSRLEPRLHAQGLSFAWEISPTLDMPPMPPFVALHVLRILQEAVTNVLKHAAARVIHVRCGLNGTLAYYEIADDGRGFAHAQGGGRGLLFMQQRARRIGAALEIDSQPRGTRVRLSFHVKEPA